MIDKIYPIGVQNFESLRKDGYYYIDKTELIYKIVSEGRYYFLSRPRRFGKSLLLSTIHAYFDGKRELFEGLAIEQLEKNWVKRPVLHLDLNIEKYDTPESLDRILENALYGWEGLYGANPSERSFSLRFAGVIRRAYEQSGHRVAILVDEYDKPMLQSIDDEELQKYYRSTLKSFYGVLKTMDGYIKLGFLTGVTKFGKVSVFSDLNNLIDLSMNARFHSICGVTEEELHRDFEPDIRKLAEEQRMTFEEACQKLKEDYDGYHFTYDVAGLYNPFSLLNTFFNMRFDNYWFQTGTPTFLVELLQKHHYDLYRMAHEETTSNVLDSIDSMSADPIPVIYQSGYLTIKGYDKEFKMYRLGFPNDEVKYGFMNFILPFYTPIRDGEKRFYIGKFVQELRSGDVPDFLTRLKSFFADFSYELSEDKERYYQVVFYLVFKLMGEFTEAEVRSARGRADAVVKTPKYIYVFEFKLNGTAEQALQQIDDKGYLIPYLADGREIVKVGVEFCAETRNISRWLVE